MIVLFISTNNSERILKMKKILCAILACALCATAMAGCGCSKSSSQEPGYRITATEPDLKNENFGFFILNQNEVMITAYYGSSTDIVIPETMDNYKVTVIGHSVFNDKGITSVTMPDSIKEIQDYAFSSNRDLKSVQLSSNLQVLGTNVFFNCRNLESIELPATIKKVGVYCFSASGLKSVNIPESSTFTQLDQFVFYQCQNLTEVILPATMTNIAENTFADCPNPITIKAPKGSYGLNYAKTNGFTSEEII